MSKRRILVTGGSRGIGSAIVRQFAQAGDRVAFTYLNSKEQADALAASVSAVAIRADAANEDEVKRAVADAACVMGGIDVLVNNAGISHIGLMTDMTLSQYEHLMAVNLTSAFLFSREVLRLMLREKNGSIVNISSVWGTQGASCEVAYSASKAALVGMTKALAKEVGPSGIRVNAVAPGVIDTEMNGHLSEEDRASVADMTPLCRIGSAEEVARAVYFLAGEDASFITGAVLDVSGGFAVS